MQDFFHQQDATKWHETHDHRPTSRPAVTAKTEGCAICPPPKDVAILQTRGDPFTFLIPCKGGNIPPFLQKGMFFFQKFWPGWNHHNPSGIWCNSLGTSAEDVGPQRSPGVSFPRDMLSEVGHYIHLIWNHTMSISDRNRHIQTMCIYIYVSCCMENCVFLLWAGKNNRRLFGESKRLLRHPSTSWLT